MHRTAANMPCRHKIKTTMPFRHEKAPLGVLFSLLLSDSEELFVFAFDEGFDINELGRLFGEGEIKLECAGAAVYLAEDALLRLTAAARAALGACHDLDKVVLFLSGGDLLKQLVGICKAVDDGDPCLAVDARHSRLRPSGSRACRCGSGCTYPCR